jgi:nucleotide-binding universal stress UspA family protein
MFKKILSANDGSEPAFRALATAIGLAKRLDAELHMIAVEEVPGSPETIDEIQEVKDAADRRYRAVVKRAHAMAADQGLKLTCHVVTGHPVQTIVEFVRERGFDLLVIGPTRNPEFLERIVGSPANHLARQTPCAVLVAR